MDNLYNEHHDGMTRYGSNISAVIDNMIREAVSMYGTAANIFELESVLGSSVSSACAEFRIHSGLERRKAERENNKQ